MKVLIVDDDKAIVDVIQDEVNWDKLGVSELFLAYNIVRAKEILEEEEIDIVISDFEMPGGSGIDLLKWYRAKAFEGKFLLLTCHESFNYASDAIRYRADEYLTKPFDVVIMEMELKRIIEELVTEKEERYFGRMARQNRKLIKRSFLSDYILGNESYKEEELLKRLESLDINLDSANEYRVIVTKVNNPDIRDSKYGEDFIKFFVENGSDELCADTPTEGQTVLVQETDGFFVCTITSKTREESLTSAENLISYTETLVEMTVSVCISDGGSLCDLPESYKRVRSLLESKVMYYGQAFFEWEGLNYDREKSPILEEEKLDEMLNLRDRKGILDYLKNRLDLRVKMKSLEKSDMEMVHSELRQSIYTYMAKKGIRVSTLMNNDEITLLTRNATDSVIGMIKWASTVLEICFERVDELSKSEDYVERINNYVAEHYMENIGRSEIGREFFLAPEYVSKLYKKKTGINLKDYINEFRVKKAKELLTDKNVNVSDVAEMVGFSNQSYFSVVFKKETGEAPNEYRRNHLGR